MLKVKINGKTFEAEKGEYVLEVCRRNRVPVPTLCHHEGVPGLGACRLCAVEINEGNGNKVVVSCVYPLNRDCEVFTESEKIKKIRRTILSMLKTKAPDGDRLASLCQIYGVGEDTRFAGLGAKEGKSHLARSCVLCGLCAQACASTGAGAISTVGRGVEKKISTPYEETPADCIGCGSCAAVCPTKAIECTEANGTRSIWGRKFTLLRCASCGRYFATREEYEWALKKAASRDSDSSAVCDACRKKKSADVLAAAFGERTCR